MRAFGRGRVREALVDRPEADLGAVELEGVEAQGFGGGEAVRARWRAGQAFFEEVSDRLGPGTGMITTRGSGDPGSRFLPSTGEEVVGEERVEAAAG